MLYPTLVSTDDELHQILHLQQLYLRGNNDATEEKEQGFVTVHHSFELLSQLHQLSPSIIVKNDDKVVAYALTMVNECRPLIPVLIPMFEMFDKINYNGKLLHEYKFYVMGQIGVHKDYRGKGLVQMLYDKHKEVYSPQYDFIVTEIATRNTRSIRAHEKIGFKTIHHFTDATDDWDIVLWDWK
ncbi:MAG: GNAT family N-acetyltransferase [Sphingobacteriales bacterium]|nr:MAG: GNAT family N-acetyltransferase [Sphingobacteriales bacterium]